jgi:LmbE family N-acetylglucosaminyl deacetylase/SAM-dependent methyltransferase
MVVRFSHAEQGTPEEVWRHALDHRDAPALPLDGIRSLVVVAAHPDDETLGAGGLLFEAARRGLTVTVVVATSGEGSHPSSSTHTQDDLARMRRAESRAAAERLAPGARVLFAGIPDGGLAADIELLERLLSPLLGPDALVVAPWTDDGHPDHAAAGDVARRLGQVAGAAVFEYPIWLWHWGGESDLPTAGLHSVVLTEEALEAKRAAIAAHRSQVLPLSDQPGDEVLLHAGFLEHFTRPAEYFIAGEADAVNDIAQTGTATPANDVTAGHYLGSDAPAADPADPDRFDRMLEHDPDPWRVESRWYERRKRAVLLASLPAERHRSTFEAGCSTGVLSRELALRSDAFFGVDVSERAVIQAQERNTDLANVRFDTMHVPWEWPSGGFDLIVASEMVYYLSAGERGVLIGRMLATLEPEGSIVICHWRHATDDTYATADEVTAEFVGHPDLSCTTLHDEQDFVLAVLARHPAVSVAQREGIVP